MKRILISSITALVLAGGFFLPSFLMSFKDRQMIGQSIVGSSHISFETKSELGILDRLRMITTVGSIPVENGKKLDADTVKQKVLTEVERFNAGDVIELDAGTCKINDLNVSFYVDSVDPAKNMIVWRVYMEDDKGHVVNVSIDDETGTLLSMQYISKMAMDEVPYMAMDEGTYPEGNLAAPSGENSGQYYNRTLVDPETLVNSLADYYGLSVEASEQKSGGETFLYELKLSDGSTDSAMRMMVTMSEYWINF